MNEDSWNDNRDLWRTLVFALAAVLASLASSALTATSWDYEPAIAFTVGVVVLLTGYVLYRYDRSGRRHGTAEFVLVVCLATLGMFVTCASMTAPAFAYGAVFQANLGVLP